MNSKIVYTKQFVVNKYSRIHTFKFTIDDQHHWSLYITEHPAEGIENEADSRPECTTYEFGPCDKKYPISDENFIRHYLGSGLARYVYKLMFDYTIFCKYESISESLLFKRLYLDKEYPDNYQELYHIDSYDDQCLTGPGTEYWLTGDSQMNVIVYSMDTTADYSFTGAINGKIPINTKSDDYLYKMRAMFDAEYPKNRIYKWVCKHLLRFYGPLILEKIQDSRQFPDVLSKLICLYVIS